MNRPPARVGRAFVLGGGIAGIAAALELCARGRAVVLLEARGWLGGRVFSREDERLGGLRDNGPHVALGCYDAFRGLLRELGTEVAFRAEPTLTVAYADSNGRRSTLRLPRLPVPLAMPWALLCLPGLSINERARALWGLAGCLAGARPADSLETWLARWRQHGGPRRFLWDPLCLAVMNAPAARVSARLFLQTMRQAFTGRAGRAAIWVPDRPWSAIVGDPALRVLRARGADVRLGVRVAGLEVVDGRVARIATASETITVDADDLVVSTLPWHRLAPCLPPDDPLAAGLRTLRGAPIVSVYFAVDHDPPLPDAPLVALVDGDPFHFLVRRPSEGTRRFAVLAGGADALDGVAVSVILARACEQLARHFPGLRVDPAHGRVVKEARATVLVEPGAQPRPRCGAHPVVTNLRLAGDWCDTGLPSTMEGAALSARLALAGR